MTNFLLLHPIQSFGNGFPSRIFIVSEPEIKHLGLAAIDLPTVRPLYFTQLVTLQAQVHSKQVPVLDWSQLADQRLQSGRGWSCLAEK